VNPLKIITLLIALVSVFIPVSALAAGKHALLIGIQDYNKTKFFNSLKGPANDVKLTKGMLRERFGFQDEDFIILLNDKATHTGIENAFNKLIKKVNPGDFVYINYSGHGSRTADLNSDERDDDSKDETWVSYGSRSSMAKHKDNYDVLDDEIGAWLADLYAKTDQVIFVSDSCHSATVSRAVEQGEAQVRAVEEDEREHLLGKKSYAKPKRHRGIRAGAAGDDESANDFKRKDGKYYGVFTWYWVQNLHNAQVNDTWHNVFWRTYEQVRAERHTVQQPHMEGDLSQKVLGINPKPRTIPVTVIAPNKRIRIEAGTLEGVTKGSVYRLYKSKHPHSQKLPRLTISEVQTFASFSELKLEGEDICQTVDQVSANIFGKPEKKCEDIFQTGDQVIEESHAYQTQITPLYLEADFPDTKDKPLLKAIEAAFQRNTYGKPRFPTYRLTKKPSEALWRLHLLRPKRQNGQLLYASTDQALPKSFLEQPPELWVLTQEQRLLNKNLRIQFDNDNPNRGIKLLEDNLNKLARLHGLKALQSPAGSELSVEVQVSLEHIVSSDSEAAKAANCERLLNNLSSCRAESYQRLPDIEGLTLSKGDILYFTWHNKSQRDDYFCYLINISPDGAILTLFPELAERESPLLKPDETRMGIIGLEMEQIGRETLKVITSTQPIDVSLWEQSKFEQRADENLNPLEQLLLNAMHGWRKKTEIEVGEWATGQVSFEVK
jgi:hypothetical protein